jgi:hypothetical protein
MKDFFKPIDFELSENNFSIQIHPEFAAKVANKKLQELIESWPVVYGQVPPGEDDLHWFSIGQSKDTHKARLAFIEEIKKEPEQTRFETLSNGDYIAYYTDGSRKFNGTHALPPKEPCKHELDATYLVPPTFTYVEVAKCRHCGVKLQATWEAKK